MRAEVNEGPLLGGAHLDAPSQLLHPPGHHRVSSPQQIIHVRVEHAINVPPKMPFEDRTQHRRLAEDVDPRDRSPTSERPARSRSHAAPRAIRRVHRLSRKLLSSLSTRNLGALPLPRGVPSKLLPRGRALTSQTARRPSPRRPEPGSTKVQRTTTTQGGCFPRAGSRVQSGNVRGLYLENDGQRGASLPRRSLISRVF